MQWWRSAWQRLRAARPCLCTLLRACRECGPATGPVGQAGVGPPLLAAPRGARLRRCMHGGSTANAAATWRPAPAPPASARGHAELTCTPLSPFAAARRCQSWERGLGGRAWLGFEAFVAQCCLEQQERRQIHSSPASPAGAAPAGLFLPCPPVILFALPSFQFILLHSQHPNAQPARGSCPRPRLPAPRRPPAHPGRPQNPFQELPSLLPRRCGW